MTPSSAGVRAAFEPKVRNRTRRQLCANFGFAARAHGAPMNFASDNTAGAPPPLLDAIVRTNPGLALGYRHDTPTPPGERRTGDIFQRDAAPLFVPPAAAPPPL